MNYFEELLNSYQLIKKRKFSVSLVVEQADQFGNIAAALSVIDTIPIPKKGASETRPVPTNPNIVAYNTVRGGGLRHTQGQGFPGSTSYDRSEIARSQIEKLMSGNPEVAQALDSFIGGQAVPQEPEPAPAQAETPVPTEDPMQAQIPLKTSQNPEVMAQLELAKNNLEKLKGDKETGSFISKSTSFWDQAFKRFYQTNIYSGSFASKLDDAKVMYRTGGGKLVQGELPPELAAKGTATLNKFLETAIKLHRNTLTREDALEIRKFISLSKTGKGIMLKFEEGSDDGLIINWDTDDSLYAVLVSTYREKLEKKANFEKELGTIDELDLPEENLSGGGKNFNNLRGTVSESFQAITTILMRGIVASQICAEIPAPKKATNKSCKDANANKIQALTMLKQLYLDNRENLIQAFEVTDRFLHEEVPGTKATQQLSDELQAMLDFVKEEFPKKLMEGAATPEDKAKYAAVADKIFFSIVKKLSVLDAKTVLHRSPLFVGETGQSEANSKKTDITEVYESKAAAVNGLLRMGYSPEEAKKLVVPFNQVVAMYGGEMEYSRITKTPLNKVKSLLDGKTHSVLNGIKTYIEEDPKGVALGSGSYGEALNKIADPTNASITTFAKRLGIDPKKLSDAQKEFSEPFQFLQGLKNPQNFAAKDRKSLINTLKDYLASKGLANSYQGLSSKSESEIGKTLTQIQTNILFDKFDDLVKKDSDSANTIMSMIIMSAAAADINQQTEARYLTSQTTYSFNHNDAVESALREVKNGTAKFQRSAGQTIKIVDDTGEVLLQYNVATENNVVKGSVHLPLKQMKRLAKTPIYKRQKSTNDSTEILITLLSQQKQLIESLLTKYQ
jgi:hypothetical protein